MTNETELPADYIKARKLAKNQWFNSGRIRMVDDDLNFDAGAEFGYRYRDNQKESDTIVVYHEQMKRTSMLNQKRYHESLDIIKGYEEREKNLVVCLREVHCVSKASSVDCWYTHKIEETLARHKELKGE